MMGRVLGGLESDLLLCYFSFLMYLVAQCVMAMKEHDIPSTILIFYPTVVRGYTGVGPFQRAGKRPDYLNAGNEYRSNASRGLFPVHPINGRARS